MYISLQTNVYCSIQGKHLRNLCCCKYILKKVRKLLSHIVINNILTYIHVHVNNININWVQRRWYMYVCKRTKATGANLPMEQFNLQNKHRSRMFSFLKNTNTIVNGQPPLLIDICLKHVMCEGCVRKVLCL